LIPSTGDDHAHLRVALAARNVPELSLGRGDAYDHRESRKSRELATMTPTPDVPAAGAQFGPYLLDECLGVGGMGEVWRARRNNAHSEEPVALKVLHQHIAGSSAQERFTREGQILKQLSHPHIARLLDAGSTSSGTSYLVLEYVEDGVPIDRWCDEHKLDIPARLQLFLQICAAVRHAHTHLVIHRDLKPQNILVTRRGEIKLLDFGTAKLLAPDKESADETELTRRGGRTLTPDFAAPEQILGLPVTTATDVYALGVLLFLLLCGRSPYSGRQRTMREVERALLEDAPPTFAAALSEMSDSVAEQRAATPHELERMLVKDLETIVQKALRVEPERRYRSVEQLAEDIQLYLAGRPVTAAVDTWAHRARSFLSSHVRGVLLAAIAALIGIVLTIAG
jgi:serine/threonine-protein kinase